MRSAISAESPYLSVEAYLAQTDRPDTRQELVNGVVVDMPPERDINLNIARTLMLEFVRHLPAAWVVWGTEIEVTGQRATCRLPDLLVHTAASKAAIAQAPRATLTRDMPPPALVVEVVSPGQVNRDRDYRYKYSEYAARGIAEYWIVDPETQQITLCRWVNGLYETTVYQGDEPLQSSIVPEFALTPAALFD